jgi:hypothetical protein
MGLLADEPKVQPAATGTAPTTTAVLLSSFVSTTESAFEDCGECIISSKETIPSSLQPITPFPTPLPPTTPLSTGTSQLRTPAVVFSDETDESDPEVDPQQLLYSSTSSVTPLKDRSLTPGTLPSPQTKPIKLSQSSSVKRKASFSSESISSTLVAPSPLPTSSTPPTTKMSLVTPPPEEVKVTSSSIKRKQQELLQVETKKIASMSASSRKKKKNSKLSDIDDIFGELG